MSLSRSSLLLLSLSSLSVSAATADLSRLSLPQAQDLLQQGKINSVQLTEYYLKRIALLDDTGPALHAVTDTNPDALNQAKTLDAERKAGKIRGPLHGMPVLLKANIATADQLPTTAGALVLKDFKTSVDATLVSQLRAAGAVILGKTNLSEWANFRGEGSASGWSALGGQTKNPYVLSQSPCGSSSGSGVAVAADLTLLAVGTETDGSITCPAAINNVVGIKPTHGAVSGHGIIPIASSQDIAGPMTRNVADAAALLQVIATPQAQQRFGDLNKALAQQSVRQVVPTVVLVRHYDKDFPAIAKMLDRLKQQLTALGVTVKERQTWQLPDSVYQDEFNVLVYEYKRDLNQWLEDFKAPSAAKDIKSIIAFNQQQGKTALAFFGQQYLEQAQATDLEKQKAAYQQARQRSQQQAAALLDEDLVDGALVIVPATGPAWAIDHVKGDQYNFGSASAAAISGYPSLTLPAGFDGHLPLGVSIIGKPWQEARIIGLAHALEQQRGPVAAPTYRSSL
ncbi:amidase [Rheinheimera texasensis]|uniref:amidase n=1 Tax=Rheinheimera texasensis TaxID=306205 RepID=UPI00068E1F54|nr:amidase [Rheinheimera texasensis]